MPGILDLMGYVQNQGEQGRQRGQRLSLNNLISGAMTAPEDQRTGYVSEAARIGGLDAATGVQKALAGMDDGARAKLGRYAQAFIALPDEQKPAAYAPLAQMAASLQLPVPQGPYQSKYAAGIAQLAQSWGGNQMPSAFREFQMTAEAAGLKPGTAEYQQAANIALGRAPRAVTGATRFDTFKGADGRPRPQRNNPTTGQVEIYNDATDSWAPLGDPISGGGQPTADMVPPPRAPSVPVNIEGVPPEEQQRISRMATLMQNSGYGPEEIDAFVASRLPDGSVSTLPSAAPSSFQAPAAAPAPRHVPGLGVGRTQEEEAGKVKAAEYAAQIAALPTIGGIEARNAGEKEVAVGAAQTRTAAGVEAAKQFGQDSGKAFAELQASGRAAGKERARLMLLRADLEKTYTGPGANALLGIKRAANAFGIKVDGLAEGEAARALSNQLALALRNPAGGEGMPGAMSNSDREFLRQSVPSLENSPQGWRAMVNMRIALADSAFKQAKYAEQLRRQGVPIQDIPGRVQDFANQNPVFQVHDSASSRRALLEKY